MRIKPVILAASLALAGAMMVTSAEAAGSCPSQPHGKCPAKKKISKSRNDFSAAERQKILSEARKICTRKYGATSTVYRIEYDKWRVVCTEPGY